MNENVLATFIRRDKSKAFSGVKPLDSSSTHKQLPYKNIKSARHFAAVLLLRVTAFTPQNPPRAFLA